MLMTVLFADSYGDDRPMVYSDNCIGPIRRKPIRGQQNIYMY